MEKKNLMIVVGYGKVRKIARAFSCSESMVSKSLHGHKDNALSKKIRHTALTQYGGVEMEPVNKDTNS